MTTIEANAILFDMDGVLVSSIASVVRCWREFARRNGVPNAESLAIPHGTRAVDIIKWMVPGADLEKAQKQIEDIELADLQDTQLLPGAKALLDSLPVERWAIVSSASRRLLTGRLNAVGLPIPHKLVCAEMVERGKPHPEPYTLGARVIGVPIAQCLVVEDAPNGIASGVAAGAQVLGVVGTQDEAALRAEGATWLVRSLADVRAEVGATIHLHVVAR